MHFKSLAGLAAVFAATASVFAAEPVDVSPLVNDRTVVVAQIDLNQIKLRPYVDWLFGTLKRAGMPADTLAPMEQGGVALSLVGQPSIDSLRRAGVTTLGVVVQLNDNITDDVPPVLLLAVPKPADPKPVLAALGSLGMRNGEKGNLMVFSPNLPPGVLGKMTPVVRPDLAVTLDTSAVAAAAALSDAAKAEVLAKKTSGPDEAAVIRDVKRYEMRVDTANGPHLGVTAETTSPEAAATLKEIITKQRDSTEGRSWASMAKALPLAVDGASLVLDAGQPEMDAFAKAFTTVAQPATRQKQSMSNMRSLIMATILSANERDGATPTTLADAVKSTGQTGNASISLTTNPAKPELGANGYTYVRSVQTLKGAKNLHGTVAIYEAGDFGEGINVAFWDGHVELLTDEAKFKAMLSTATQTTAP